MFRTGQAFRARERHMDESTHRYRELRSLLEDLVASWPWDRPGTPFEAAKVYLDFHCADCGAKLSVNDLAVVLELEMLRLGTIDARSVPYYAPICVRCYLLRAGPACRTPDRSTLTLSTASIEAVPAAPIGSDQAIHLSDGLASASVLRTGTALTRQVAAVALPQQAGSPLPTSLTPPRQRSSHSWLADLTFGVLMLVVLIVVLLMVFQPVRHAVIAPPAATPATTPAAHQGASLVFPIDWDV